jgi:predicted methyltransferase
LKEVSVHKRIFSVMTAIALLSGAPGQGFAQDIHPSVAAAVADTSRPERDRLRDTLRKPAETLAFAGVQPGMRVMDLMPGGGYFTRILSKAVGEQGRIHAFQPHEVVSRFSDYRRAMDALDAEAPYDNVSFMFDPIETFTVSEPLDVVFTALNYHDIHADFMGPADAAAVNRAIFTALRPGGLYVVIRPRRRQPYSSDRRGTGEAGNSGGRVCSGRGERSSGPSGRREDPPRV